MKILATLCFCAVLALAAFAAAGEGKSAQNWVRFQVWSPDSVALLASYYPSADSSGPVALMLHDRGGQGSDLAELAQYFQAAGIPVFLPDLRGEGQSVESRHGRIPPAERWGERERHLLERDLERILLFAQNQPILRERDWVLVAVGEAAALALELKATDSRFKRLALLSPRVEEDLVPAALASPDPVLLIACDEDEEAAAWVRDLYGQLPAGARRMDLLPCRSRGARIIRWVKDLDARLHTWSLGAEPSR